MDKNGGTDNRDDTYKVKITTPDPGYAPFPVSIMDKSTHEVTMFDPSLDKPATISYSLNKAGCVRVRLVHRQFPDLVIRTLQDWTEQSFGRYQMHWDGRDSSGNIVDNKKVFVLFESKDRDRGRVHQKHETGICREPAVRIDAESGPHHVGKGEITVHAVLSQGEPEFADDRSFEVRCYLDYRLYKKEKYPPGNRRFTLTFNPNDLGIGKHLITVNIDDCHDHVGSAGVVIDLES